MVGVVIVLAGIVSISLILYRKQGKDVEKKGVPSASTTPASTATGKKRIRYVFVSTAHLSEAIMISDAELKEYYDSLPGDKKQAGVQGQEIVLRIVNPNSEQQVLERANQIIEQLKKEGSVISEQAFAESAKGNSENPKTALNGGRLPAPVRLNQNNPSDPYQRLTTMQPGEITEPIKYQDRFFILRRGDAIAKTFEEAKNELSVSLRNRRAYEIAAQVARNISDELKRTKDATKTAQIFMAEVNMDVKDMVRETPFIKPGDDIPGIGVSSEFYEGIANLKNPDDVGDVIRVRDGFAVPMLIEIKD
jgi:hypothetical protein